ncbi:MAG: FAD-binding oxidoreductase [Planctomycetes bacterium]|nr:FAD-binding oxidoreductase [Planctomycetota bacterium]
MSVQAKRIWIAVLLIAITGCTIVVSHPTYVLINAWWHDRHDRAPAAPGQVDDASRLNATRVAEVWPIPADPIEGELQLRALLQRAKTDRLKVSIAGAKHSMGGHTISPDGVVIDMLPFKYMELDARRKVLHVGAGARWSQIVPFLDAEGLSVSIMQSNNDFTVGGSLSVNCHGWQCRRPPIADSVISFRLMKADGVIVTCSREENRELFSLALGGYGLFGIILDAELRVVPNERYRPEAFVIPSRQYAERFRFSVNDDVGMAYGRLCVVPGDPFLKEAILTVFRKSPCAQKEIPPLKEPQLVGLKREVFRAQIGSVAGKELRWKAEKKLGETGKTKFVSRNQLFNESAEIYQEQNADRTDILHEYFVPQDRLEEFLMKVRAIVPKHPVDLLNVTVRDVRSDGGTFFRYADREMFALVMLFNQPRTQAADLAMQVFTRAMIDAALDCGGRYYLPYRLHASEEQFRRAYPRGEEFFAKKREFDPDGLFINQFYLKYAGR